MFQAAVLTKKNKIQIQNFEIPKLLRKDQVLVKIKYAGIVIKNILDKYLVIDSDTFFLKPTSFIKDGKCLYNY